LLKFVAQKRIPIKMLVISAKFKIFKLQPTDVRSLQNSVFPVPQHNYPILVKKLHATNFFKIVFWPHLNRRVKFCTVKQNRMATEVM